MCLIAQTSELASEEELQNLENSLDRTKKLVNDYLNLLKKSKKGADPTSKNPHFSRR
jgi:hypothetical protein